MKFLIYFVALLLAVLLIVPAFAGHGHQQQIVVQRVRVQQVRVRQQRVVVQQFAVPHVQQFVAPVYSQQFVQPQAFYAPQQFNAGCNQGGLQFNAGCQSLFR
jgi:hypothetical protein